jgi:hypothetical protein
MVHHFLCTYFSGFTLRIDAYINNKEFHFYLTENTVLHHKKDLLFNAIWQNELRGPCININTECGQNSNFYMSEFRTCNPQCKLWSKFHFPSYMSNMSPILHEADIQNFFIL